MINVLDSYFVYVKTQMALVDPSQVVASMVNARDWPQTQPIPGALYLLFVNAIPLQGGSEAQNKYEFQCQWNWLLMGNDVPAGIQMQNRADRYRVTMKITKNLRDANYPSFTQKRNYSVDSKGTLLSSASTTTFPYNQMESIYWSRLKFVSKLDNDKSGITYGVASVSIFGYDDVSTVVAV